MRRSEAPFRTATGVTRLELVRMVLYPGEDPMAYDTYAAALQGVLSNEEHRMSEPSSPAPQTSPSLSANAQKQVIRAAKNGDAATLKALIETDPALVGARDTDGSTPLHCASWKGHAETVTLLLDLGADVNAKNQNDHWGDTPLHAAAHGNQRAVAEVLLARGADLQARNTSGRTPLAETGIHGASAVANLLKRHDATE